jgi:hypothetical protein
MHRVTSDTREKSEEVEQEDAIRMRERKRRRKTNSPRKPNKEKFYANQRGEGVFDFL